MGRPAAAQAVSAGADTGRRGLGFGQEADDLRAGRAPGLGQAAYDDKTIELVLAGQGFPLARQAVGERYVGDDDDDPSGHVHDLRPVASCTHDGDQLADPARPRRLRRFLVVFAVLIRLLSSLGGLSATETPQPITNVLSTPLTIDGKTIVNQLLIWTTIALVFGGLLERFILGPSKPAPKAAAPEPAAVR